MKCGKECYYWNNEQETRIDVSNDLTIIETQVAIPKGENTIKINGVPVICFEMNTKDLFLDILDGIDITNRTNTQEIEEKFIATVACKAAVKANMKLDEREIRGLLDQLMLLENPFTCPHGRPTAIRISKYEIEKKFNRR